MARDEDYDDDDDDRTRAKPRSRKDDYDDEDDYEDEPVREKKKPKSGGGFITEKTAPHLVWVCQAAFWVSYSPNLLLILTMDTAAMRWVSTIAALLLGIAALALSLYTLAGCAKLYAEKKSPWALAAIGSAIIAAIGCTHLLMCDCGLLVSFMKSGGPPVPGRPF